MTREEFGEVCCIICPLCDSADEERKLARYRNPTREWVHDVVLGSTRQHTLCRANAFRNSRFAEEAV